MCGSKLAIDWLTAYLVGGSYLSGGRQPTIFSSLTGTWGETETFPPFSLYCFDLDCLPSCFSLLSLPTKNLTADSPTTELAVKLPSMNAAFLLRAFPSLKARHSLHVVMVLFRKHLQMLDLCGCSLFVSGSARPKNSAIVLIPPKYD